MKKRSRNLSPSGPRSRRRGKTAGSVRTTKGVQVTVARKHRDIDIPQIFVKVPPSPGGYGWRYAQARMVLRRRGRKWYRYLVWKQRGRTRMLYLGSVKISALLPARTAPGLAPAAARALGGQE